MKTFKTLIPVLFLIALSFYGYYKYVQFPSVIINGIVFLPVFLAVLVVGLAIHFNRSSVFFYAVTIIIANLVLGLSLASTELSYALLSIFLPLLIPVITMLPERGIISARAIPAYTVFLIAILFSVVVIMTSPEWANYIFLTNWLPPRYFDWTHQSQTVLIISFLATIYMIVLYFLRPSPHVASGLGIMIMLIVQLHSGHVSRSLNIFSSIAFFMCLYAVMQESWRMAYLDELTELPSRRALREKFQKISGLYAVAMLDVDHFKKFNDTYGHDTGDAVLRMIATKLKKVTGGGSYYRYGGEEFTIVFNGKSTNEARLHLENLRELIATTPFVINRASRRINDRKEKNKKNKSVVVTVSIGMADSTKGSSSPWDVMKSADKALYRAKEKGRNCLSE